MNLKLSFSWIGPVVFALPMLINIAYVIFPPAEKASRSESAAQWIEIVEQVSRIAYLLAITFLVSQNKPTAHSIWFCLAVCFLILYYAVWLRYFIGGRAVALLNKSFLLVPMPLAVFPVLYFLFAGIWLNNIPAVVIMAIFGAAHLTVSIRSFN